MRKHLGRRGVLVATAAALAAPLGGRAEATPVQAGSTSRDQWARRAELSYDALQTYLYLGPEQPDLYLEKYPKQTGDNAYSYLWPFREATAATIDMAGIPSLARRYRADVPRRFDSLRHYWGSWNDRPGYLSYLPPPIGGGGDIFFDDNAIVGLELVRQFAATRDPALLRDARTAFDVVARAWNADPTLPCPGGMRWVDADWIDIRAANVTGLAAQLAAHLYEYTRQATYREWAERLYGWNHSCLRSPEGLYWNDIGIDGTINKTLWTYNSGAMIGAGTLLYRSTGISRYRTYAREDATAAIRYWTEGDRYFDQPAIFNAILFKNLLLLDSVAHDRAYRDVITRYATHIWDGNRDPDLGLFRFPPSGGGDYDPSYRPETLEQSAAIQIFATLAWSPGDYGRIA
ncbi:glycoside hydrolase family 76 protein [Actinopolymorpha alba]|uniref:glycoside hydrolase family 76 protein n=1 Tax=Actinopolymorpha alba TaxID=533267 RepID=UPI0003622993|nr:glycoside hydrolase family 76 protein [Actinopolymorpha alba]